MVIEALRANKEATSSELYVFCDGPKDNSSFEQRQKIEETRALVHKTMGFGQLHIIESETNIGLDKSVLKGINHVLSKYDSVIVLEDDIIVSSGFLGYMNKALRIYANDDNVMNISAYWFPVEGSDKLPASFFLSCGGNWGWATWERAWNKFDDNVLEVIQKVDSSESTRSLVSFDGHSSHYDQLLANRQAGYYTWDIFWHTSIILRKGLTLFPNRSLVNNIGMDGSGEHSEITNKYYWPQLASYIELVKQPAIPNEQALRLLSEYFRVKTKHSIWSTLKNRLKFRPW